MRAVRHRLPPDVLLLVTVLFWSFNFTAAKYALTHGFAPLVYSAFRFGLGALLFAGFTYTRERTLAVQRGDVLLLLGAAALGIWLNQVTFVYAVELTTAATVALVFGTLPIFVALIARLAGLARLRLRFWLATGLSFIGVVFVALGASGGLRGDVGGILLGLGAAGTWAGYSLAIGILMRRYSPYRISALVLLAGCVPLFATALRQLVEQDWTEPGALAWGAVLYGLVFSLVVTNILWFTAIDRVGAARSSLYANLQPFLGAVFAVIILSESLSSLQVAGGFLLAAAIILAGRGRPVVMDVD